MVGPCSSCASHRRLVQKSVDHPAVIAACNFRVSKDVRCLDEMQECLVPEDRPLVVHRGSETALSLDEAVCYRFEYRDELLTRKL